MSVMIGVRIRPLKGLYLKALIFTLNMLQLFTEHLRVPTHMKTPLTKIPPVIYRRYPPFGRRMLGLFLISLVALYFKYESTSNLYPLHHAPETLCFNL